MKNKLTIAFILSLIFISCSKDSTEPAARTDEKTVKVDLNVLGANDSSGESILAATPLKDLISQLTVIIYTAEGTEYSRYTQLSNNPSFGQVSLELPIANYTFVAVGSKTSFGINNFYQGNSTNPILSPIGSANMQYLQSSSFMDEKRYKTSDTFFAKRMFTVMDGGSYNLSLQRIVGKLEIGVEDVDNYDVTIYNETTGYMFSTEKSFGATGQYYESKVIGPNKVFSCYILKTDSPLRVEITGGGKFRELQVPVFKNQRTIIKGKLLAPTGISGLNVSVSETWSTDSTLVIF